MSPIAAAAIPGSAAKDYKQESTVARLLGSGTICRARIWVPMELILTLSRIGWYC